VLFESVGGYEELFYCLSVMLCWYSCLETPVALYKMLFCCNFIHSWLVWTNYNGTTCVLADKDDVEWRWYCWIFCLKLPLTILIIFKKRYFWLQYIWVQVSNGFFKKAEYPQNEVWDGEIIENEGGLYLGI
jgi:hypothetical protein